MEKRELTKQDIDKVRGIEGFPIGSDEDIIALSDSPYYTACPNPFIEEFIRENGTPYDEATDDYQLEDYLKPLVAKYDQDLVALTNGQRVSWASFNTWGNLGTSYNTAFIRQMQELDAHINDSSKGATAEQSAATLAYTLKNTVQAVTIEYDYDTSKW